MAFCFGALVCTLAVGCQQAAANPPRTSAESQLERHAEDETVRAAEPRQRDLASYVPAGGLQWLVSARPAELLNALGPAADELLPQYRLEAFYRFSGIDLRQTTQALAAGYAAGSVFVLQGADVHRSKRSFIEQMDQAPNITAPAPGLTRFEGRVLGVERALLELEEQTLVIANGDRNLVRIAELYALGQLKSPTAFHGAALSPLLTAHPPGRAQLEAYAVGPLPKEWRGTERGVVDNIHALSISLDVHQTDAQVLVRVHSGLSVEETPALVKLYREVSTGDLGRGLGTDTAFESVAKTAPRGSLLTIRTTWNTDRVLAGLNALLSDGSPADGISLD